jgi:hypothetical protein
VNVLDRVFHVASSSQAVTMISSRLFFAVVWPPQRVARVPQRVAAGQHVGQPLRRQVALLDQPAAALAVRKRALVVWWSSTANGNGTNSAGAPTAARSRHGAGAGAADHQVASAKAPRRVVDEGRQFRMHASAA